MDVDGPDVDGCCGRLVQARGHRGTTPAVQGCRKLPLLPSRPPRPAHLQLHQLRRPRLRAQLLLQVAQPGLRLGARRRLALRRLLQPPQPPPLPLQLRLQLSQPAVGGGARGRRLVRGALQVRGAAALLVQLALRLAVPRLRVGRCRRRVVGLALRVARAGEGSGQARPARLLSIERRPSAAATLLANHPAARRTCRPASRSRSACSWSARDWK